MQIDWFTVGAQIVNFLILVGLLKLVLYDRIVRALDARREHIAAEGAASEKARQEAEAERDAFHHERAALDEEREAVLSRARDDAEARRRELDEQVRAEIDARRGEWLDELRDRQHRLVAAVQERAGRGACEAVRQALADLTDVELEQQALAAFTRRIEEMSLEQREEVARSLGGAGELKVASAWPLSEANRDRITEVLRYLIGGGRSIEFEVDRELICGVEVRASGRAVGWTMRDYVDALEDAVLMALREEAGMETGPAGGEAPVGEPPRGRHHA